MISICAKISGIVSVEITGRCKPVLTDKWDPTIDTKKQLEAVHLGCDRENEHKAERELSKMYGNSSTEFALGIRMQLIAK